MSQCVTKYILCSNSFSRKCTLQWFDISGFCNAFHTESSLDFSQISCCCPVPWRSFCFSSAGLPTTSSLKVGYLKVLDLGPGGSCVVLSASSPAPSAPGQALPASPVVKSWTISLALVPLGPPHLCPLYQNQLYCAVQLRCKVNSS